MRGAAVMMSMCDSDCSGNAARSAALGGARDGGIKIKIKLSFLEIVLG